MTALEAQSEMSNPKVISPLTNQLFSSINCLTLTQLPGSFQGVKKRSIRNLAEIEPAEGARHRGDRSSSFLLLSAYA
jgi:hypothetical protein